MGESRTIAAAWPSAAGRLAWVGMLAFTLAACSGLAPDGGGGSGTAFYGTSEGGESTSDTAGSRPDMIQKPTMADLMKAGPLGDRVLGRADAPVTVIEYASLTCPYSRAFHVETWPAFRKAYIDTGKVRFILREFPIGRSSGNAWIINRCFEGEAYFDLYDRFLRKQHLWVSQKVRLDAIFAVAKEMGMTRKQFDSCLANQAIIDHIKWVKQRGRRLGVTGTPTFFIGERKERSVLTLAQLAAIIEPMLAARGRTASAAR